MSHNAKTTTNTTAVPTYNPVIVKRIDRVVLVLAIIASACLIFAGAHAGNNADAAGAQMPSQMVPHMSVGAGGGTLGVNVDDAHVSVSRGGGTLAP